MADTHASYSDDAATYVHTNLCFCSAKGRYVVTVVRCNGFLPPDASQHDLAQSAFWTFAFRSATYICFLTFHRSRWMSVCSTVLLLLCLIRKARECLTALAWAAGFLYNAASAALLRNTSAAEVAVTEKKLQM